MITGGTPSTAGTSHVTVIARDGSVTGITHFDIVVVPSLRAATVTAAEMSVDGGALCLDDTTGVEVVTCGGGASQLWAYQAAGGPNSVSTLIIGNKCLGASSSTLALATCNGSTGQHWEFEPVGAGAGLSTVAASAFVNVATGKCLAAPSLVSGQPVALRSCSGSINQAWTAPAGPFTSGAGGTCLHSSGSPGAQVSVASCDGSAGQQWTLASDGTIRDSGDLCLDGNNSALDATAVVVAACSQNFPEALSQLWVPWAGGQLINVWSGRCLAHEGPGTGLVQEDCYGQAGEIWGIN